MSTVTSVTKHFASAEEGFTTTLASTVSSGATTVPLNSVAGYTNGEVVVFVVDPTNVSKKQAFTGTIDTAGVQVTGVVWTEGTNQDHTAGATVVDYATATHINMMTKGILVHADQDGTLKTSAVQDALGVTTLPAGGWDILNSGTAPTVSTGYNKGNREYDLTFSNVDLSSTLSPGMRFKIDRTGTTPTQCTDLEASSSQYWSKTSPAGISFTDDFTCEAWIKLESYPASAMTIVSRYNGTSGWMFRITNTGQVNLIGANGGAANQSNTLSNQSLPLNRWVHVAACLDMSTFTSSASPIYIDGVSVPVQVSRGGTNPTALVQAGNLQVGAENGATLPFDGEISDVRVWSAVRTATQIRDNMNTQLVGNESNLVAYFKLSGDANDSTSNANNLSANGGATATTVDNPMKDTEYGLITKVSYSAPNTTVTVITGTNNNIPNMTLENPFYSTQENPFGWPGIEEVWTGKTMTTVALTTSDTTLVQVDATVISGATYLVMGTFVSATGATAAGVNFGSLDDSTTKFADMLATRVGTGSQVGLTVFGTYTATITGNVTFRFRSKTSTSTSTVNGATTEPITLFVQRVKV